MGQAKTKTQNMETGKVKEYYTIILPRYYTIQAESPEEALELGRTWFDQKQGLQVVDRFGKEVTPCQS